MPGRSAEDAPIRPLGGPGPARRRGAPLRILSVGGARGFTSTFLVRAAVERGHRVTVLTRGAGSLPPAELPAGVEVLVGDRTTDLGALAGRTWDVVVDFGAFGPEAVSALAAAIPDRRTLYVLISTIMTYAPSTERLDETSAVLEGPDLDDRRLDDRPPDAGPDGRHWWRYGRGKVLAEERARALDLPVLVIRPGVIAGPSDPAAHLEYWYDRWTRPGDILVPGSADDPVQFIDSRDLAVWLLSMIERGRTGTFNAVGPDRAFTMVDLMRVLARETGHDRSTIWVDSAWLSDHGVPSDGGPFFWVKPDAVRRPDEFWISYRVSDARARAEGLVSRSPDETVRDGLQAFRARSEGSPSVRVGGWADGVDEGALLHEWIRRRG